MMSLYCSYLADIFMRKLPAKEKNIINKF